MVKVLLSSCKTLPLYSLIRSPAGQPSRLLHMYEQVGARGNESKSIIICPPPFRPNSWSLRALGSARTESHRRKRSERKEDFTTRSPN